MEVLWKQDVDLGYSLAPIKTDPANTSTNVNGTEFNADDNEKLKVLQDLKDNKVSYTIHWSNENCIFTRIA